MKTGQHIIADITTDAVDRHYKIDTDNIPVLPLRDSVMFPYSTISLGVARESTISLVKHAVDTGSAVILATQKSPEIEEPKAKDIYRVGVVAKIMKFIKMPDDTLTIFAITEDVYKIERILTRSPFLTARISRYAYDEIDIKIERQKALYDSVCEEYDKIIGMIDSDDTTELRFALSNCPDPTRRLSFMAMNSPLEAADKQKVLEERLADKRMMTLLRFLHDSRMLMQLKAEIQEKTQSDLTAQQREAFLQRQMRLLQDELGGTVEDMDVEDLRCKAEKKKWSKETAEVFDRELKKLSRFAAQNPEYSIQYNYLETMLALPWEEMHTDDFSLKKVREVLDRDHSGLDKVKQRIVEQMAVIKLRGDMRSSIICLAGPPGVGKTSLGRSIAEALGREYARISLGGLHDEAEIRGHRRTYIGAMPGRIISALKKLSSSNPVIVLDEIDKVGKDFKGDPSTALLEVLDPEQNFAFHDNYLDVDYDLSHVLFIATANDLSTVSSPLLDRMEIIRLPGYIPEEKIEIASCHLVDKELESNGFAKGEITFTEDALRGMIEGYTREAGVRQLSKTIARALRRIACQKAEGEDYPTIVTPDMLKDLLGEPEIRPDKYEGNEYTGVVTGLAWTQVGGEILFVETSLSPGKGETLTLTGNLGNVMKESAAIALKYIRANAEEIGISRKQIAGTDVHIHVPEGAIPKDGPSAGITMLTSLASAFTGRRVRPRIAMTGEMTLRGKVLPVGGIKEKIIAAKNAGINTIVLSRDNKRDISEIEPRYLEGMTFHYVDDALEVLRFALLP